nr:hypothetical protein GCM10020185_10460 [Pseudomonas brassicacearum subsp. brassicacearum]
MPESHRYPAGHPQPVGGVRHQRRPGEVGGEHGNAIYLHCPNLINIQFQALRPKFEGIAGVFGVKRVGLMPSERRHMELNALLGALEFPVLSIDMGGSIVAANRAAAQLLGVRVDEVPGIPLSRYAEDFDLPELVRANQSRINGLRVKVKGDVFLADIAPLQSEHDDSEAMAGAVLTLHRADRVGERIYNVRKQELRGFDSIFQSSKVMAAVVREARRMAPLDAPLLIEGETGTGKELLARACHLASPRGQSPLMALNCAGLPESMAETELFGYGPGAFEGARAEGKLGLLELTAGGTLFLDGVGEMSPRLQVKLLRFLQDGCFRRVGSDEEVYLDVRVICATQVDLSELCARGEFRQDLYHRLNVLSLHIPAAARMPRWPGAAGGAFPRPGQPPDRLRPAQAGPGGDGPSQSLPLAGQCPATGKTCCSRPFPCAMAGR